jgi:hypothetical protein
VPRRFDPETTPIPAKVHGGGVYDALLPVKLGSRFRVTGLVATVYATAVPEAMRGAIADGCFDEA